MTKLIEVPSNNSMAEPKLVITDFHLLLALTVMAVLLYEPALTQFYYHPDELMHIFMAKGDSFAAVWRRGLEEMHPPLSHFIRHIALLVDDSILANRLVSLVPAVLSVILVFLLGRILQGRNFGLVIAVFQLFSPITLTYSLSIRNYALFLMLLYLALYALACHYKSRRKCPLIFYALFMLLVCATHFSGFIVLAACSSVVFVAYLKAKDFSSIRLLVLLHLPHLLLAGILDHYYFSEGSTGARWREFLLNHPTLETFKYEGLPTLVGRIFHVYANFFSLSLPIFMSLLFLSIFGLYLCIRVYRQYAVFAILLNIIILQVTLYVLGIYPMSGLRYSIYVFPFVLVSFGYAGATFFLLAGKWFEQTTLVRIVLSISLLASVYFNWKEPHLYKNYELGLRKDVYAAGINYLNKYVRSDELLITTKAGYIYFLYAKTEGKEMYSHETLGNITIGNVMAWYSGEQFVWEYSSFNSFIGFMENLSLQLAESLPERIWLLNLGFSDYALASIFYCDSFKDKIEHFFFEDNFLLFALKTDNLLPLSEGVKSRLDKCLKDSSIPKFSRFLARPEGY